MQFHLLIFDSNAFLYDPNKHKKVKVLLPIN